MSRDFLFQQLLVELLSADDLKHSTRRGRAADCWSSLSLSLSLHFIFSFFAFTFTFFLLFGRLLSFTFTFFSHSSRRGREQIAGRFSSLSLLLSLHLIFSYFLSLSLFIVFLHFHFLTFHVICVSFQLPVAISNSVPCS